MKKALLLIGLFVVAGTAATISAASSSKAAFRPKPAIDLCSDVIIDPPSYGQNLVGVGEVLTADTTGATCFPYSINNYEWKRDGTIVSQGSTDTTYTTVSADTGHTITLTETDTNSDTLTSTNSFTIYGSAVISDEFNAASGTQAGGTGDVCSGGACPWAGKTGSTGAITYDGTNLATESGTGYLALKAQYGDQDGDSDTSSATDTDAGSEPDDSAAGDWYATSVYSTGTMSAARFIEARIFTPCTDSNWTGNLGWEYSMYQNPVSGSPHMEFDPFGMRSDSTNDYTDTQGLVTWDETVANGAASTFDGDHAEDGTGDSISSDTDATSTVTDSDDPLTGDDSDTVPDDGGHGDTWKTLSSSYVSGTKICGTWHVYGAVIQSHEAQYYFDGTLEYTVYTSSSYGTPNLGLNSSYSFTASGNAVNEVLNLTAYIPPPSGTANTYMDVDYVHVYNLS